MKTEWEIRSIKHWKDGSWDVLLVAKRNGRSFYERVVSTDGFNWVTSYNRTVEEDLQNRLTEAVGDMVTHGIRVVVF